VTIQTFHYFTKQLLIIDYKVNILFAYLHSGVFLNNTL